MQREATIRSDAPTVPQTLRRRRPPLWRLSLPATSAPKAVRGSSAADGSCRAFAHSPEVSGQGEFATRRRREAAVAASLPVHLAAGVTLDVAVLEGRACRQRHGDVPDRPGGRRQLDRGSRHPLAEQGMVADQVDGLTPAGFRLELEDHRRLRLVAGIALADDARRVAVLAMHPPESR